jgi:hypothetical protein
MAEYLPLYKPGHAITSQASAAITAGQLLEVTGTGTVGPAGAASTKTVGVAAFDTASGEKVTFFAGGVQRITAAGAVTAGDLLAAGAAGKVAAIGANAFGTLVGLALTTAADTALVEVQMSR